MENGQIIYAGHTNNQGEYRLGRLARVSSLSFLHLFLLSILFLVSIEIWGGGGVYTMPVQAAEPSSLYKRLGGYDAISQIIDEFLQKMWSDPQVGKYFVGMGTDTREQLRQKNKLLMCKNTGGPCKIINRDMKLAHAGLGISNSDWKVAVGHLVTTLRSLQVGEQEQKEILQLIGSLKGYIVEDLGP